MMLGWSFDCNIASALNIRKRMANSNDFKNEVSRLKRGPQNGGNISEPRHNHVRLICSIGYRIYSLHVILFLTVKIATIIACFYNVDFSFDSSFYLFLELIAVFTQASLS